MTRPHCRFCGKQRPWWQWITLPAYLLGYRKCPACGKAISLRHPLTELGLAAAYVHLWLTLGPSAKLAMYLIYGAIFALILITDIERRLILNVVMYPAIGLGIAASLFMPGVTLPYALAGGAIGFLFFYVAALVGTVLFGAGALGAGDVKLAAFVGVVTGFPLVIEALVLTMILGAAVSLFLLLARIRRTHDAIPYGPFLVAGAVITLLWGLDIAIWFLY